MFLCGLLLSVAVLWISADGQNQGADFSTSSTKYSVELFRATLSTERKNTVISSMSTSTILAMLQQGATNSTKDEITRLLSEGQDTTRENYKSYLNDIKVNVNNSTLEIASRDFANFGFEGSRIFEKIMSDNFNSETRHTDFTQTDIAAQMINTFTSDHTGGKIQNFVTPDIFKTNAQFLILNTINLNSNWKLPFRADRIRNRDFSTATEIIVQVPTMRIQKEFKTGYIPHIYSRWLQLPLQNDRFYVIIILPDDVTGLDTIVEDMAVQDILDIMNLMDADASQLVDAYIPQLNIKEDVSMTDTLSRLQLNSLFNNGASLCGISMNGTYVADVSHRAELVIDGNGINLAAATLATESKKDVYSACPVSSYPLFGNRLAASKNVIQALPELTVFNANHPFLAFVIDGNSKLPLFSARVLDPSQS